MSEPKQKKSNQFEGWALDMLPNYYECVHCAKWSKIIRCDVRALITGENLNRLQKCDKCKNITFLDPFVGQND